MRLAFALHKKSFWVSLLAQRLADVLGGSKKDSKLLFDLLYPSAKTEPARLSIIQLKGADSTGAVSATHWNQGERPQVTGSPSSSRIGSRSPSPSPSYSPSTSRVRNENESENANRNCPDLANYLSHWDSASLSQPLMSRTDPSLINSHGSLWTSERPQRQASKWNSIWSCAEFCISNWVVAVLRHGSLENNNYDARDQDFVSKSSEELKIQRHF